MKTQSICRFFAVAVDSMIALRGNGLLTSPEKRVARGVLALLLTAQLGWDASAQSLYWDINDATPGAGGTVVGGNWSGTSWSPDASGSSNPQTWSANSIAVFSAGNDATGSSSIAFGNGSQSVAGVIVEEGSVTISGTGTMVLGSSGLQVANGSALMISTVISSTANIVKSGTGLVSLQGTGNTLSGSITINAGTLAISSAGVIGSSTGTLTIDGAILKHMATGTASLLNSSRSIVIGSTGAVLESVAGTSFLSYGGTISGSGSLTYAGNGTFSLSGSHTYSGNTTVSSGTKLRISNSTGSATGSGTLTVANGGVIAGTGRIGALSLSGTISPGASPGTIYTGSATWNEGGTYTWEMNDATGTAGANPGWDMIEVSGSLSITASGSTPFNISVISLNGASAGAAANFDDASDYAWTIVRTTGGISGFDASKFTINTTGLVNSVGTGSFALELANGGNDLVLRFIHVPVITTDLVSQSVVEGSLVTLSVNASGTAPLSYVWKKDGAVLSDGGKISGSSTASLFIGGVTSGDVGSYQCFVSNSYGDTSSASAFLSLITPPEIVTHPSSATKYEGETVAFTVFVSGSSPFTYQWYKNSVPITGATQSGLTIGNLTLEDAGDYSATVSNDAGEDTSDIATLTILMPPCTYLTGIMNWWKGDYTFEDSAGGLYGSGENGVSFGPGKVGGAFYFDGDDDRIVLSRNAPTGNFTIETWVKFTGVSFNRGTYNTIVEFGDDAPWFGVDNDGVLRLNPTISGGAVPVGEWAHVAYTWDGASSRLFVNGVETASNTSAPPTTGTGLGIGKHSGDTGWLGFIDEVTLFDNALTEAAIAGIYAASGSGKCTSPPCMISVPSGVVGWWSGNSNGLDKISGSTAILQYGASYAAGNVGQGFSFNGLDQFAIVPDATNVNSLTSFTWEMWIKPTSLANSPVILSKEATIENRVGLQVTSAGALGGYFDGGNFNVVSSDGMINAGVYTHVAYTFDDAANEVKLYVNGTAVAASTETRSLLGNTAWIEFGRSKLAGNSFAGIIDEVTVYSRALSQSEIESIYEADDGGKCGIAPSIVSQPANTSANAGSSATLSTAVTGSLPLAFQWYKDGTPIFYLPNVTDLFSPVLHFTEVSGLDSGIYKLVVSNESGVVISANATLSVSDPAVITAPQSITNEAGTVATFSVVVAGSEPLTFEWKKDGILLTDGGNVSGTDTSNLIIANVQAADEGTYTVRVTNPYGSTADLAATLTVNPIIKPVILVQPVAQTSKAGVSATFTVSAIGGNLNYQWKTSGTSGASAATTNLVNSSKITGADSATLTIRDVALSDVAFYRVTVWNSAGTTNSIAVKLSVLDPAINGHPVSQTKPVGGTVFFGVQAGGTSPFTYQWKKGTVSLLNNARISGANSPMLTITGLTTTDAGNYKVTVTNSRGSVTSSNAALTVVFAPLITSDLMNQVKPPGGSVTFNVTSTGTAPLTYQWQHNGSDLTNDWRTSGASTATLTITDLDYFDAGDYTVIVSNGGGSATDTATLTVFNELPDVAIVNPTNSSVFAAPASITVTANASDSDGSIRFVEFYRDSLFLGTVTNAPYTISITNLSAGTYSVSARAVDNLYGSEFSDPVFFDVTAECFTAPSGVIGWWRGEGNSSDFFGKNNGVFTGGATTSSGRVGDGFFLDGIDDGITIADSPTLNFGTNSPMTIELWVHRNGYSTTMPLVSKRSGCGGAGTTVNYELSLVNSQIVFGAGETSFVATGKDIPFFQWVHVAATFDGTLFKVYLDGELVGTANGSLGQTVSSPLRIGDSGCGAFQGLLDEVAIYNRALSQSEVQAIFASGNVGKCSESVRLSGVATFGGLGDQRGSALAIYGGAAYVAGVAATANGDEGVVGRLSLPLTNGATPTWSTVWPGISGPDRFGGIAAASDGLYVAGESYGRTSDTLGTKDSKGMLVKFSQGGASNNGFGGSLWDKQTPPAPGAYSYGGREVLNGAATVVEAGITYVYLTGSGQNTRDNTNRLFVTKVRGDSTNVWTVTDTSSVAGGGNSFSAGKGIAAINGGIYVVGRHDDFGYPSGLLRKYKPDGNLAWNVSREYAEFNAVTGFGGAIYAAGANLINGDRKFFVEKRNEFGHLIWLQSYGTGTNDSLAGIVGIGNRIYAVGTTKSAVGNDQIAVLEIDPQSGNVISMSTHGGQGGEIASGVATDGVDLYVIGETTSIPGNGSDILVARFQLTQPLELLEITTTSLSYGEVGNPYSAVLNAVGGKPPYAWSSGNAPSGLTVNSDGSITGTPNANGFFNWTATVSDSSSPQLTDEQVFTLVIVNSNAVPTVSIVSPSNGASYSGSAAFTLSAAATDSDGAIDRVAFFQGSQQLGVVGGAAGPYNFTVSGLTPGSYSFTAIAFDDLGASAISAPVSVRVNEVGSTMIDFEALDARFADVSGTTLSSYLASHGVYVTNETAGSVLSVKNETRVRNGNVTEASSGDNLFSQSGVSGKISYTLGFPTSLASFSFTRTKLIAGLNGVSHPTWVATAYDATGMELGTVGEDQITSYSDVSAQTFRLDGPNIAWVRIQSDDRFFTMFHSPLLDDFLLGTIILNQPPTVAITSPSDGASFTAPANITLSAAANDSDGTISLISFFTGQNFLGSVSGTEFASITISNLGVGTYNLRAVARDSGGAVRSSSPIAISVVAAPGVNVINFDSLDASTRNIGGTTLSNYLANYGITLSGITQGARMEAADVRNLYGGRSVVAPSANNVFSQFGVSGGVSFTLTFNTPQQSVRFTRPALLAGSSGISHPWWRAKAYDSSGMELASVAEQLLRSFSDVPARHFELAASSISSVRFESDGQGGTTFAAVLLDDIIINANAVQSPLEVSITSPAHNSSHDTPLNLTVAADATNHFGSVSKVEFYSGPLLIGTDTSAPYSVTWADVLPGVYTLSAKVIEPNGGARLSSPVNITVNQGVGGNSTVINFDSIDASSATIGGPSVLSYLAGFGITVSNQTVGTDLTVQNQTRIYNGNAVDSASSPNLFTQTGPHDSMGFTLQFAVPLQSVHFTRPKLKVGWSTAVTHPAWTASAYDGVGNLLAVTGEDFIFSYTEVNAQTFSLTGQGIAYVHFESENRRYAAFSGMLMDNVVLTTSSSNLPPVVNIVSPSSENQFFAPALITITANAFDSDGTISQVKFFQGSTQVGAVMTPPYTLIRSNLLAGTYIFTAQAVDNAGASRISAPVRVQVVPPPNVFGILEQPQSQSVASGGPAEFSVSTTPVGTVTYQWQLNEVDLTGQTDSSLTIAGVTVADEGDYTVAVTSVTSTNTVTIFSDAATLTVVDAPVITTQPEGQIASAGDDVTFSVVATGATPLFYQWMLNGNIISGATGSSLELTEVEPQDAGAYSVVVANSIGGTKSERASLLITIGTGASTSADDFEDAVSIDPLFSASLGNNSSATKETGEPNHAGKAGGRSIWFTWHATFDGVISLTTKGSDFDTLLGVYTGSSVDNLTRVAADDDSGGNLTSLVSFNVVNGIDYHIAVDGFYGASGNVVLSLPAGGYRILDVSGSNEQLPLIISSPTNQSVTLGSTVVLTVEAESETPLSFQWFHNSTPILDATGSSLTLENVDGGAVGVYSTLVANDVGSVETRPAHVQVITAEEDSADPQALAEDKFFDAIVVGLESELRSRKKVKSYAGPSRGYTTTQIFNTSGSSKDPDEPNHCGVTGGKSVWYSYVAPATGTMQINTTGSSFNTVLAVYRGDVFDYESLISVACDNSSSGNGGDKVQFNATSGTIYYIVVDGVGGVGGNVTLNVNLGQPPAFEPAPQSQATILGETVTFTVGAGGSTNLYYQWRFNGTNIAGATGTSLVRTNISTEHLGPYTVVVSNMVKMITNSPAAQLTIAVAPTITNHPASSSVTAGNNLTLTVTAGGSEPRAYQWRFDGIDISGATNSSLALTSIQTTNAGLYSVHITNIVGSVTSTNATVSVAVPIPTFATAIKNNLIISNVLNVTGTSSTNARINQVQYRINAGSFEAATGTTAWSALLSLPAGTNTVDVRAVDLDGFESDVATRTIFMHTRSALTVQTNGLGHIKSANTSFGHPTNTSLLIVGRPYKLTAVVTNTYSHIFTNWTNGEGDVIGTNLLLNFTMSSNLVVSANFIPNPFIAAAGIYNGLFYESDGIRWETAGSITMRVTPKMSYSAKMSVGGDVVSVSGKFSAGGTAIATASRTKKGKDPLTLAIAINFGSGSDQITGTVSEGENWTSDITADRLTWDATTNAAVTYSNYYTMVIPGFGDEADGPVGDGYGTVKVDAAGKTTFSGGVGDGQVLKSRSTISKTGEFPLFVGLYPEARIVGAVTNKENQGFVMAWISLATNTPAGKTTLAPLGDFTWLKTGWTNGYYDVGFTNEVEAIGSLYVTPLVGARVLPGMLSGDLALSGGGLPGPNTTTFSISTLNAFTVVGANTYTAKPGFKPGGALKGTFLHPTHGNTAIWGAVLQDYNYARGYFQPANKAVIQRGRVTLDPAP